MSDAGASRVRVVVVDDQPLVRMGLRTLIGSEDDLELVGEAEDGRAALDLVRRVRPDVALMDIRMPRLDGIEAMRAIAADPTLAGVRVVVLTTFETTSTSSTRCRRVRPASWSRTPSRPTCCARSGWRRRGSRCCRPR